MADYATLLDHVTLTCRSVDRIFLQAYRVEAAVGGWVCQFLHCRRASEPRHRRRSADRRRLRRRGVPVESAWGTVPGLLPAQAARRTRVPPRPALDRLATST